MKVLIFLPLLSLLSMGSACFWNCDQYTTTPMMTTTTMPTTTTTTTTAKPIVTRQATSTNSCTGAERGSVLLRTVPLNLAAGAGATAIVSQSAAFTSTGTERALCHIVNDRNTGASASVFTKTAGDFGTTTVTITAFSAAGQSINADVNFFGTL